MTSWKTYKYTEFAYLIGGGTPKTSESLYWDGDIPWLSVKDFVGDSKYVFSTEKHITKLGLENSSTKLLQKDDIIISARGTIGEMAMIPFPMSFNQSCFGIRANGDLADPHFLYYYTKTKVNELKGNSHGSVFDTITRVTFDNIICSLPPLAEQRRIAGILGAIDDKIENNRRINTNLELQAQALYKQWFVDNRKDDWKTLILDDVATLSAGGDKPQVCSDKKTPDCNIPIYSNGIDNEGLYGYTDSPRITENSITISARGTIGFVCLRTEAYVPIVRLISVVPTHENMSAYFLYLWALTQNISGTGTTQQQLTVPAFRTTKIVVPSQETLIKFNQVVKPIFDNIRQNKKGNETLATLRDTLLPKLMNGEIIIAE